MNLYLVRHTEVEWNKRGLFTAQAFNLRLNPTGLLEAERLAEKLDSVCFTGVLSSDQIRAVETGLVIAGRHAEIKFFKTDPRMREVNVGNLVGTRMSEVTEPTLRTKHPSFDFRSVGGECRGDAVVRQLSCLVELRETYEDGNYLIVGHGTALRILLESVGRGGQITRDDAVKIEW